MHENDQISATSLTLIATEPPESHDRLDFFSRLSLTHSVTNGREISRANIDETDFDIAWELAIIAHTHWGRVANLYYLIASIKWCCPKLQM